MTRLLPPRLIPRDVPDPYRKSAAEVELEQRIATDNSGPDHHLGKPVRRIVSTRDLGQRYLDGHCVGAPADPGRSTMPSWERARAAIGDRWLAVYAIRNALRIGDRTVRDALALYADRLETTTDAQGVRRWRVRR